MRHSPLARHRSCHVFAPRASWSWVLLTLRAGCTALGALVGQSTRLGYTLSSIGSALTFPAFVQATVTFVLWNAVLFPMLLCMLPADRQGAQAGSGSASAGGSGSSSSVGGAEEEAPKSGGNDFSTRRAFLKFNFSFFMVNIHMANLPLALLNVIYGAGGLRARCCLKLTPSPHTHAHTHTHTHTRARARCCTAITQLHVHLIRTRTAH